MNPVAGRQPRQIDHVVAIPSCGPSDELGCSTIIGQDPQHVSRRHRQAQAIQPLRGHCTKVEFTYARIERTVNADDANVGRV